MANLRTKEVLADTHLPCCPQLFGVGHVPRQTEMDMGKKLNRVYEVLLYGAASGMTDEKLYQHVMSECPKTSSKRIVRASLLALTDPAVKKREVLEAVYALAIKYRLVSLGIEDDAHEADDEDLLSPTVTDTLRTRLAATVAPASILASETIVQQPN